MQSNTDNIKNVLELASLRYGGELKYEDTKDFSKRNSTALHKKSFSKHLGSILADKKKGRESSRD